MPSAIEGSCAWYRLKKPCLDLIFQVFNIA